MMAAPVTTETNLDFGTPVALFLTAPRQPNSTRDQFVYDVSKHGQCFLILTHEKQAGTPSMTMVLNRAAKLNTMTLAAGKQGRTSDCKQCWLPRTQ
jgi:hypothetical protein